jgi:8-oxo-dGTP pyrophosphatase MutT (NUDIX family)
MKRIPHSTAMGSYGMKGASSRSAKRRARVKTSRRSSALRRERGEQVAAVCYRIRADGIEFLLVQSRGGRWIFPKGSIESRLTRAQSAALEAFEEAGVHGRIEETSFARYLRRERGGTQRSAESASDTLVHAYLCEVHRLGRPKESDRNRTWFTAEKAKRRLKENRAEDFGADLARVVDRALSRIQRIHSPVRTIPERMHRDALQKVRLEAFEEARLHGEVRKAALVRYFLRQPALRLGTGSTAVTAHNISAIDSGRRANLSKSTNLPSSKPKAANKLAGVRTDRSPN